MQDVVIRSPTSSICWTEGVHSNAGPIDVDMGPARDGRANKKGVCASRAWAGEVRAPHDRPGIPDTCRFSEREVSLENLVN